MSNFVLQTSHPLIQREQTFVLDRKLISVHSVDRDYQKWPNSNHFGIDLGEAFHNVQSMRLINFSVPSNNYTFSTAYQNTKMSFTYQHNYLISMVNWGTIVQAWNMLTGTNSNTFNSILDALWGAWSGTGHPNKPGELKLQVQILGSGFQDVTLNTTNQPVPTGWTGIARIQWNTTKSITIPEGSYSPTNLASTIQTLMNEEIFNSSSGTGFNYLPGPTAQTINGAATANLLVDAANSSSTWFQATPVGISPFVVYYDSVTNRILFGVTTGSFTLRFSTQEIYDPTCDVNKAIFHQYTKWGLPSYLGFDKKVYDSSNVEIDNSNPFTLAQGGLYLPFEASTPWLVPSGNFLTWDGSGNTSAPTTWNGGEVARFIPEDQVSFVSAEYNLDINGEDAIYMEIDRYNSIDEIYPYSERTGHLYNNDLGHRVNGSFAKIPLTHVPFGQEMGSRNNFVLNVFHSDPPIQRIDRLKFTFRFHDGRLVDFKNLPFSFTLEFNMLKDEQTRGKHVRVPPLYNL